MTTWLLPPRSGATFTTPSGNVITATLARPTPFADSDVVAALAQGWTYSDSAPLPPLGDLIPIQFTSGLIQYPFSSPLATGVPNVTLTDAIGTTATAFAFVTIRGGSMGANSQLDIRSTVTKAGTTIGNLRIRVGQASGTFATATAIGGQGGISAAGTINNLTEIWNTGTLNSQLGTPVDAGSGLGASGGAIVSLAIDTALDWNIYFGWVYTGAPTGGDSVTLRKFRVEIKN